MQEVVNVTASHGVFVRVRAGINIVTNEATCLGAADTRSRNRYAYIVVCPPFREFFSKYYAVVNVLCYKPLHCREGITTT